MPITVATQRPVVNLPTTAISPSPIYLPYLAPVYEGDIVWFATGTRARGFFLLAANFVPGDTITYTIGAAPPVTLTVTPTGNIYELLHALEVSINANSLVNLVTAYLDGNLVIINANTPGVGGNAITLALTTTSATGEVAVSGATLVGGSALASPGSVQPAPVNTAIGIVGMAICASVQTWHGFPTGPGTMGAEYVFGASNVGSGLFSAQPGELPILTFGPPAEVTMNLPPTVGWQQGGTSQATYGTPVGINKDPVTGFYIVDPTVTNLVAVIQDVDNSVNEAIVNGQYQANPRGLLAARVKVVFNAAALAIVQGG
jgi:hypothetical protein